MADISLAQASDFNAAKIFAYIIFGVIGFAVFLYGKKNKLFRPLIIGVALMVYPYFISGTFFLYSVGIIFILILYFWRDK